jgi:hypothetical protein
MHRACGVIDAACNFHFFAKQSRFAYDLFFLKLFKISFRMRGQWHSMQCASVHAVSMTPYEPCMRCQRHRMLRTCGVCDTWSILKISNFFANANLLFMRKGFSPLIRAQDGCLNEKIKGRRSLGTVPLIHEVFINFIIWQQSLFIFNYQYHCSLVLK